MPTPLRGVLLDIDGTLLDSNDAHANAWIDALREDGFTVDFERVRRLIGKGGDKVLDEIAGLDDESKRGKAILARRSAIFKSHYLAACRPFPEARALVERMKRAGLAIVVATSASDDEVHDLLRAAEVLRFIDHKTTSDDAERSKPDPDIIEAAIARAKLPPSELVMIGDTPYDVEAATRANVDTIAVCSGGWKESDLAGAVAVYRDVADLLAHYDRSRLARR